jgi:hypothetical protein
MNTNLDVKIKGVRGGEPQFKKNVEFVSAFINGDKVGKIIIENKGKNIQIGIEGDAESLFEGSFDDLLFVLRVNKLDDEDVIF